ncbi:MAG TPA: threonine synthase [Planctomycetes bacterium]|nr:threonine synthase [Planctomycetota bacterium]
MGSHVSHLEAAIDGTRLPARTLSTTHRGRPLWVRYDLESVGRAVSREDLANRPSTLWRYRELLPVEHDENIVSLGEGCTPLVPCPRLGAALGVENLWIKDESQLPTGSFKSRGLAMAVSMAKELGVKRLAIPTAGNAGGALAAYGARAGLETFVFLPADTPLVNRREAALFGARAFLVDGLITDCGAIVREGADRMGWFDVSTLKEPYRIEGKKTMGLELAEDFEWSLPEWVLYPTGGGTGLIGMWKAFAELGRLGWLESDALPRMVSCQSDGCAPIVRAFEAGERFAEEFEDPATLASGLRVPKAVGDFMILDAVRSSGGCARAAAEGRIPDAMARAAALEGISLCPEAAACLVVLEDLATEGSISRTDRVVVFNTGAAQKYVEVLPDDPPVVPRLASGQVDFDRLPEGS